MTLMFSYLLAPPSWISWWSRVFCCRVEAGNAPWSSRFCWSLPPCGGWPAASLSAASPPRYRRRGHGNLTSWSIQQRTSDRPVGGDLLYQMSWGRKKSLMTFLTWSSRPGWADSRHCNELTAISDKDQVCGLHWRCDLKLCQYWKI